MRPIWALLKKDLHLHGRSYAVSVALIAALTLAVVRVVPIQGLDRRYPVSFNFAVFGSLLYGQWLIDREKARRTLAWLRSMPVSDVHIVASKVVVLWVFQGVLFAVLLSVSAPDALARFGAADVLQKLLAVTVFATWLLAGKWLLGERLGQLVAGVSFLLVFGLDVYLSSRAGQAVPFGSFLTSLPALLVGLIAPCVLLVRVLSRRDTAEWVA
jgi:hypothetical protein